MIAKLTGMDVANASVYDGGSGPAGRRALMAVRSAPRKHARTLLLAGGLNPRYRAACEAIVQHQGLTFAIYSEADGSLCPATLEAAMDARIGAALVISQPNSFSASWKMSMRSRTGPRRPGFW